MFKKKLIPMEDGTTLENVEADYKTAKRVGQFKVSANAIYKPDGTYLPFAAVTETTHDKTSVHVSGCCAGGVPVDRIILDTEKGRFPFIFDTAKDVQKILDVIEGR